MEYKTADDVLRSHWDGLLPINPKKIAEAMGISVQGLFLDHSGHYSFNDGSPLIQYNCTEPAVRQRFTLAHEIGHHVHGDMDAPRDTSEQFNSRSRDPREVAANRFAAALLMPDVIVKHLVREKRVTGLAELSKIFGVSTAAMEFRLRNIGLI